MRPPLIVDMRSLCPGRENHNTVHPPSSSNFSLVQILPQLGILPQTRVFGSQDNESVPQLKVSMLGFVLVSFTDSFLPTSSLRSLDHNGKVFC